MIETRIENPEKLETVTADSQGRVSLGVEYAARDVRIVVVTSEEHQPESGGLQHTIGDQPMNEDERKGMLFVRSFGIDERFLKDEHTAETNESGRIDPNTVSPVDVDWSIGVLFDPEHVAVFEFDEDSQDEVGLREKLTEEPASVTAAENDGEPVYRYRNEQGDTSDILRDFVENVQRILGYDPSDDRSHVRVHPAVGPAPVMFHDPESDTYVAIAPRVEE